jgi:glycerophosphoryl diester phosphodiesterase
MARRQMPAGHRVGHAGMTPYLSLEHPIRLAHRGSRVLWPENTMLAFQGAVDLGYRYLELDVRVTADDVVVVHHDATLDRTTSGAGPLRNRTLAELLELDAAHHFQPDARYPLRGSGERIPTLEQVLTTWPEVHVNIDLKAPGSEWPVAEVITRLGRQDSVMIGSFSDRRVGRFRRITRGRVATSVGPTLAMRMWSASRLGRHVTHRAEAFQMPYAQRGFPIDRRFVDAVHASRAHVHVWTVNDADNMRRMLGLGVDGIITDRPDLLNEVLEGVASGGDADPLGRDELGEYPVGP